MWRSSKTGLSYLMGTVHSLFAPEARGTRLLIAMVDGELCRLRMSRGDISSDEAAAQLIERLDSLTLAQTGMFQHAKGDALPW